MTVIWQDVRIGDAFRVVNGGTPKTSVPTFWGGPHAWITPAEMGNRPSPLISTSQRTLTDEGLRVGAELVPPQSIILSTRAPIGHLVINEVPMAFNQGCKGLIPTAGIDTKFAYYFLLANVPLLESLGTGATFKELSSGKLKEVRFPHPPLAEQRRIVALLDEAFEAIATAKANTEKNLENARNLVATAIAALLSGTDVGWAELPISQCFKVKSGDFLPAKAMDLNGTYPVYGGNGIVGKHSAANLAGDHVIIGRVGAKCGNVRHVKGDFWLTDNAFYLSDYLHSFDHRFLALLLAAIDLRSTANQAAQPVISYSTIKNVLLRFPISLDQQKALAERAANLDAEVEAFRRIAAAKLAALDELKQSLLHQAFTGQLTAKSADRQLAEAA